MKSKKGSKFERDLCKKFSLWWTGGKRDDVFWRSAASGGRATNRSKRGQKTYGSYGDIAFVDPIGKPLLDWVTIELKRGYSKKSFADIIDRSEHRAATQFEEFIEQASGSAEQAGTPYWMLITRRDDKQAVAFFPRSFLLSMRERGAELALIRPFGQIAVRCRTSTKKMKSHMICFAPLAEVLKTLKPEHFK